MAIVGRVERAQRLLVAAPRGLLIPPCVVRTTELERRESEGWVQIQGSSERVDGRAGVAEPQLGEATRAGTLR
ncbi:MAG: hypothetical protein H0V50_02860 [Thermoleophilaceae bacterium]|nr:hypothetical protein [Thermoleophilaceae bacterium]